MNALEPQPVSPLEEMARVLDHPPDRVVLASEDASASITAAWRHGALHGRTAAMSDHVFMTYLGAPRKIERRSEGRLATSYTHRGSVTLIPAHAEARWDIGGDLEVVHFYLSPGKLSRFCSENDLPASSEPVERTGFCDETGSRLLLMLAEAAAGAAAVDRLFADQATELLVTHLLRSHSSHGSAPDGPSRGGLAPRQLERLVAYLDANLAENVSLDALARIAGLSPFHLCRAFKASTGLPPHRWRAVRRMERAKDLLERTDRTITDIALTVGYDGPGGFATAFRTYTGVTATEYRRDRRS